MAKGWMGRREVLQTMSWLGIVTEWMEEDKEELEERCRRGCGLRVDMGGGT